MKNLMISLSMVAVASLLRADLPTTVTQVRLSGISSISGVMATPAGGYFASDASTASIHQYDASGTPVAMAVADHGNFMGMDVDVAGHVVVVEQAPCRIDVLAADGTILKSVGQYADADAGQAPDSCVYLDHPSDVAVGNDGNYYVADTGHNRIAVFSGQDGSLLRAWGHLGYQANDELYLPMGLTVSNGMVYVADAGNGRVMVYGLDGSFIKQISGRGVADDQFDSPFDVAVDGAGRVWVADNGLQKLVVFDGQGQYLGAYGLPGDRNASFEDLTSLYAGEDGTIVIGDGYTGRAFTVETGISFARSFDSKTAPAKVSLADAQMAFGPVPARAGQPMVMSLPFRADSVSWDVVSLDMRKVAGGAVQYASLANLDNAGLESGIYLVRSTVKLDGESRTQIQKIVVTR